MISVCIATYNGQNFIGEQLLSILKQLGDEDEVIISDDCSTDETVNIIGSLNDKRIMVVKNDSQNARLGVVKNFERALSYAKGDYIFLSDQDDVWLDKKVELSIKELQRNLLIVTDCMVVDADLNPMFQSFFTLRDSGAGLFKNIFKNSYLGCCIAFRKELLNIALPFPENIAMHDMWLGNLAEIVGSTRFIEQPLLLYRRHGNNASPTSEESKFSMFQKISYRLTLINLLFTRVLSHYFR